MHHKLTGKLLNKDQQLARNVATLCSVVSRLYLCSILVTVTALVAVLVSYQGIVPVIVLKYVSYPGIYICPGIITLNSN